jgi:hypothetical protein
MESLVFRRSTKPSISLGSSDVIDHSSIINVIKTTEVPWFFVPKVIL